MRYRRYVPHAVFCTLVAFATAISLAVATLLPLPTGPTDFNSPGFVLRHAWERYGLMLAAPFRDDLGESEATERVARFLELNRMIANERQLASDPAASATSLAEAEARLAELVEERAAIENSVERIVEERLSDVIEDAGLTRRYGAELVWPPVDIELEDPPHVLVESPRDEIRIVDETLLQDGLSPETVRELEAATERDGDTSALVIQIGGIAMYPAIVPNELDYQALVRNAAHEWVHHYLYFAPLGRRYFDTPELRTLNETTANLIGNELASLVVERYPIPPGLEPPHALAAAPSIDVFGEMRDLRREVDLLLQAGRIEQAERRMEAARQLFAEGGFFIRRINQAFFAFHGFYADGAASVDPIGPKLQDLRDRSDSLAEFAERVREMTSVGDLEQGLASAR